jgi:hypothetical protein
MLRDARAEDAVEEALDHEVDRQELFLSDTFVSAFSLPFSLSASDPC